MSSPSPSLPSLPTLPPPPGDVARTLRLPARAVARVAAFDRRVDKEIDRYRNPTLDRVMYVATELGDFALVWHIIGVARGLRSDRHAKEALRLSTILGGESILVNGVVKSFFRRRRPAWEQPRAFKIRRPRSSSFPSGHASSALTAAAVLGEDDPLRPLYYGIAAVVASSRVYVKIHHASDVLAGVATGVVLGRVARKVWPRPGKHPAT
jgi:undecaprenyl-diphosphatase